MRLFAALVISLSVAIILVGCGGSLRNDDNDRFEPQYVTTPSGLKYANFEYGFGPQAELGDTVTIRYRGLLDDNTEFANTLESGEPTEFILGDGKAIKGLDEGIRGMGVGGKRKLIVPPDLAYGAEGNTELGIAPNATLSYYVEFTGKKPYSLIRESSGLQYGDIVVGTGASPGPNDTVVVRYKGWLTDGTVFDSTDGVDPREFALDSLIAGWKEGMASMKVGGVRKLVVPYDLGYGAEGSPPKIPGYATLIFRIELVDVKPADS